ncbi:MATE family efflux transporter [uncultured Ruminococcus sp.]|jgi:putative MATE family efflux protein|uniref:MATE family efflux transporter n=1 Tax=uncultured Ruminococcus sp. TaxID=165186 RepID=UPI0025F463C6|nr:MATE family efflux transporter [uncultured Ruminococcus sp.]
MNKDNDKRIYTLSQEEPAKAVLKMSIPLVFGMFIMVLYNMVDTYFIGLTGDDYQMAAVNLAYPVMMVTVAISNMIGTGASSFIARCLGAGEKEKASHTLTAAFTLTFINSIIIMSIGLAALSPIVRLLGAKDNTFLYTQQYVRVILTGSFLTMGSYTTGALLRSEGSVRYSMTGMIVGTLMNIILDPLLIFTLNMQIRGAAIATVLSNGIGFGVSVMYYLRKETVLRPSAKQIKPTSEILREIYWVGVPASLETLLTSAAYTVNNNLAVEYSELTVTAMGIAQKVLSLGSYVYQGFASGTQPIMGYNYGAKNTERMRKILRSGVLLVTGTELILMMLYCAFAPLLIDIFTDSAEVISIGTHVLRTMMFILPFVGTVSMCRMSFQAMGKPQFAFGITLVRQLILYIPLLLLLNKVFGFNGMLWAQPITEAVMMGVSLLLLTRFIKNKENGMITYEKHDAK